MQAIIGAICGDIISSTYKRKTVKSRNFNILSANSKFTDATVMTLAVANWLLVDLNYSKRVLINQMQQLASEYYDVGYENQFKKWLIEDNPKAFAAKSNDPAMRVSPVAWYSDTLKQAKQLAKVSTEITHNHQDTIKDAQAVSSAIFLAKTGHSKKEIKEYMERKYNYNLSTSLSKLRSDNQSQRENVVVSSVISFLDADDYENTIRNAISLGGHTHAQATIAGSLASAYFEVPKSIYQICISKLDLQLFKVLREFNEMTIKE